ncbi:MAG: hypothetical protein LBN04_00365 [Oscillospiraceae bacterium]|nr:hypothetical protein [Oscillospiraceae bacterium]
MFGVNAWALRRAAEGLRLPGMLRWDRSGRALLVSDAPRRGVVGAVMLPGAKVFEAQGLLYFDYHEESYRELAAHWAQMPPAPMPGAPFAWAALVESICARPLPPVGAVDVPLLRACLLATAQGGVELAGFVERLRVADAAGLRDGDVWSCRACAGIINGLVFD